MPRHSFNVTCLHCGHDYTSGDCIINTCPDCYAGGHRGAFFDNCPKCREHRQDFTLRSIPKQVRAWADHNFARRSLVEIALKVCEEAGELAGATIKEHQGIRRQENQKEKAKDALGDIVIALANYAETRGWDLWKIVIDTWDSVRRRDWVENPDTAHLVKDQPTTHNPQPTTMEGTDARPSP
jgi:NTP pyrophosphatase (non-canonical NTP hydrolase)